MSEICNLEKMAAIFAEYGEERGASLREQYLAWQTEPNHVFWKDFLGYIHCCEMLKLPDPLDDEMLARLTTIREFMPAVLRKYAQLFVLDQKERSMANASK